MKGAKELADQCRDEAERQFGYFGAEERRSVLSDTIAHLDAKAAIDSAVPEEVGEIRQRADAPIPLGGLTFREETQRKDLSKLLAIVQRQAGEMAALKQEHFAATLAIEQTLHETEQRSDAARAEVERLKADLQQTKDELSAAAHSARSYAEQMDMAIADKEATREASDRWQRKLHAEYAVTEKLRAQVAALAQENARLINEVGELDATAREQRQRAEVLARGIAAYRTGSFTLAQVWENEEGKAVQ
jgi:chromosome segregation ATPase